VDRRALVERAGRGDHDYEKLSWDLDYVPGWQRVAFQ
jgi:hypothetical protein